MCSAMEEEKNTLVGITCIFTSRDCKKECTMRLDPHEDGNVITLCLCREPSGYCIQGFIGVCTNLSDRGPGVAALAMPIIFIRHSERNTCHKKCCTTSWNPAKYLL